MRAYLDANVASYLLDRASPFHALVRKRWLHSEASTCLSIITLFELELVKRILDADGGFDTFVRESEARPLQPAAAPVFASLKLALRGRTGASTRALARHNLDLMLAASAVADDAALISGDAVFKTLAEIDPRLRVEDWTEDTDA